jgi:hypothetical protein
MRGDEPTGKRGIAQCRGPHHSPGSPRLQRGGDGVFRSEAAGHLDPQPTPDRLDDPADHRAMCRFPGPGPVEVHHVEPRRSRVRERSRDRDSVVRERRLALEIALYQPYDPSTAEVDRGQDLEVTCHRGFTVLAF